jgi:hypothetical protein
MEMAPDRFGGLAGHDGSKRFRCGLLHLPQASKVREQSLPGLRAYARDIEKFGCAVTHRATLTMLADCETVAFVAYELDQVQHR